MRNTILLSFCLLLASASAFAQPIYHKILKNGNASGNLYRCWPNSDGGYIAAGVFTDFSSFNDEFFISRFNSLGESEWVKTLASPDADEFTDVTETLDGNYIAVGTRYNMDDFTQQGVIVKLDENGDKVWIKSLHSGTGSCTANKIQRDFDGNFYVLGMVEAGAGYTDYYIVKINSNGTILSQAAIGTDYSDFALSFLRTKTGNLIIGGWANDGTGESIHLIKITPDLTVTWNSYINDVSRLFAYDLKENKAGNIVIAGRYDNTVDPYDVLIAEINAETGTPLWAKSYHLNSNIACYAHGVAVNTSGRIAVTGQVEDVSASAFILEVNNAGNVNWAKRLNSINELNGSGYGICNTADLGYFVCGNRQGIDNSIVQTIKVNFSGSAPCLTSDLAFTATDVVLPVSSKTILTGTSLFVAQDDDFTATSQNAYEDACQPLATEELKTPGTLTVFPNPSTGLVFISAPEESKGHYRLMNSSGTSVISEGFLTGSLTELNLNAGPGMYILQLITGKESVTRKIILK